MAETKVELLALVDKGFTVELEPRSWDRQSYEPHFWYQIFWRHYVQAGLTRTLRKAFRNFLREQKDKEPTDKVLDSLPMLWFKAYERWSWEDRAVLWDEDQTYQRNLQWAERQERHKQKEWEVSQKLMSLATDTLTAWMEKFAKAKAQRDEFPQLRFVDIERAVNLASRVGRLSAGLATEQTNITTELKLKARDIESVRRKRWAMHENILADLDNDPTIVIEGEVVE